MPPRSRWHVHGCFARLLCSQEEERPDRCQQDRRLPEMRLSSEVPHDARSDTGSNAHLEVPASGAADGAEEVPSGRERSDPREEGRSWALELIRISPTTNVCFGNIV